MDYIRLPCMGSPVSVFAIAQGHAQLEADYNVGGILRERPSNRRRNASTGVQLARMRYSNPYGWVDIEAEREEGDDPEDEDVRDIYMLNVLKWRLPISPELAAAIERRFALGWMEKHFPDWKENVQRSMRRLPLCLKGPTMTDTTSAAPSLQAALDESLREMIRAVNWAVKHEREACAQICARIEAERWKAYKTGTPEQGRGQPFVEGQSDGAEQCAAAIRARSDK